MISNISNVGVYGNIIIDLIKDFKASLLYIVSITFVIIKLGVKYGLQYKNK